jgi:DNA-directed RNA polymerase specialized sigma24 family protein
MYEDIKERLRNYKKILAKKNELELKIAELEQNIGIAAAAQSEAISKTYKISSMTENQAIELSENKEKLKNLIDNYRIEINHIENALNGLYHMNRQAIELRFIEKRSIESTCYIMDRTRKTVFKYINSGLRELHEILIDNTY